MIYLFYKLQMKTKINENNDDDDDDLILTENNNNNKQEKSNTLLTQTIQQLFGKVLLHCL